MRLSRIALLLSLPIAILLLGACGTSSDDGAGSQPESTSGQAGTQQGTATPKPTLVTGAKQVVGTIEFVASQILTADAASHIGEDGEVCGYVAEVIYEKEKEGRPTYLWFDNPAPNHTFMVLVEGKRRTRWSTKPENYYPLQIVCATGTIVELEGGPGMVIGDVYLLVTQGGGAGTGIIPNRQQRIEERKRREEEATKEAEQTKEAQQ